jgi:hypothetical protein
MHLAVSPCISWIGRFRLAAAVSRASRLAVSRSACSVCRSTLRCSAWPWASSMPAWARMRGLELACACRAMVRYQSALRLGSAVEAAGAGAEDAAPLLWPPVALVSVVPRRSCGVTWPAGGRHERHRPAPAGRLPPARPAAAAGRRAVARWGRLRASATAPLRPSGSRPTTSAARPTAGRWGRGTGDEVLPPAGRRQAGRVQRLGRIVATAGGRRGRR